VSTRFAFAYGVLAAVVLAAAAGDRWPEDPASDPVAAGPAPTAAAWPTAWASRQTPTAPECNPRTSLRPQDSLPAPGHMPAGSTMARIFERGHLIAAVGRNSYGFAFRDEHLRPEGFDIDIVRDIAAAIFGDPEKVVFRPAREVNRFPTVRSGQVDLVVATVTTTCKRRELVDFSTVYYEAGQRVLVNRDSAVTGLDDPKIGRVCAARGTTSLGKVLAASSKAIPVGAATTMECLMMLQLGEVDAVSSDDTLLAGMAAQDPRTEVVGPRLTEEPYGIAINKDTPDLVRFVNAVLKRRTEDGRWRASYERWLTLLGPPPSPPTPQYRD
jgi:polar amino acid transport system substrate-binding protein